MLPAIILFIGIAVIYFYFDRQRNRQDRMEKEEQNTRKALLEAVLKNSKDRYPDEAS